MILIITHKEDYTADYVIDKLNQASIPYYRFNCEDYLESNITIELGKFEKLTIGNNDRFSAVWYRRTKLPDIQGRNSAERIYLLNEIDVFLHNLFGIIKSKWLSEPFAVSNAENKLLQLSIAREIGFDLPDTLITTSHDQLRQFLQKNRRTIIKPMGRGRIDYPDNTSKLIFTNIIGEEIISNIDAFQLTPAIYQKYIEKEYELRVTVIGNDVFAASVNSQSDKDSSIDWRRKKIKFEKYDLPVELQNKCLLLMKKLNISFGAFDFIKAKDGGYYFLEINPNGQWVWIEKDTGQSISQSLINFLTHA